MENINSLPNDVDELVISTNNGKNKCSILKREGKKLIMNMDCIKTLSGLEE